MPKVVRFVRRDAVSAYGLSKAVLIVCQIEFSRGDSSLSDYQSRQLIAE